MKLFEPVLFRDGRPVPPPSLLGTEAPERVLAKHVGHFAFHERSSDGSHMLVRDLLGVHKLFFALRESGAGSGVEGGVESANHLVDLLRAGHPFERVFSVPAGHLVRLHPEGARYRLVRWGQLRFAAESACLAPESALAPLAASVRAALERTFRMLAQHYAGRPVYVTLSGGLDSTTIAALARESFPDLKAVTFALRSRREAAPGADLFYARRVAADLGLPHVVVLSRPEEVLALLDETLVYGQDYRDFNVQCGLVNAALAQAIRARHPVGPRPVVLSGDALNELLADYAPVPFRGREYFGMPRLTRSRTRRFLVAGLDSGDREVGIFARCGVETVQPHALCAREYAALPGALACGVGSKARLVRAMLGTCIPDYVLARPKVRAQVAVEGEPSGTMALLLNHGIDQAHLKRRFARLLGLEPEAVSALTRAGFYRFSTRFPGLDATRPRTSALVAGV